MKKDIAGFVVKCPSCQQVRVYHHKPGGLLFTIHYHYYFEAEDVNMDFIVGLTCFPCQYDSIRVIVDRMTRSTYFVPLKVSYVV